MTTRDLIFISLNMSCIAVTLFAYEFGGTNNGDIKRCHRGAWTVTWAILVGLALARLVVNGVQSALFQHDLQVAVTVYGLVFAYASVGGKFSNLIDGHGTVKQLYYWTCFVGTFAWVLPTAATWFVSHSSSPPSLFAFGLAAGLYASGLLLAWRATTPIAKSKGTPDPVIPPGMFIVEGLYGRMRHPIQLAQILICAGTATLINQWPAWVYAVSFALILSIPFRMLEERRLIDKYGQAYRDYMLKVPAFAISLSA